jgi:hypothetical protein
VQAIFWLPATVSFDALLNQKALAASSATLIFADLDFHYALAILGSCSASAARSKKSPDVYFAAKLKTR